MDKRNKNIKLISRTLAGILVATSLASSAFLIEKNLDNNSINNIANKNLVVDSNGYTELNKTPSVYYGAKEGTFSCVKQIKITANTKGFNVNADHSISSNSAFALKINNEGIVSGKGVYEFAFKITNNNKLDLNVDLYAANGSDELDNSYSFESKRDRVDVDLKPGETKEYKVQIIANVQNPESIIIMCADKALPKGINLDMTVKVKKTGASTPEHNSVAEDKKAFVDFVLPKGVEIDNSYNKEGTETTTFVLPTAAQIKNTTGRKILGWYDVETNKLLTSTSKDRLKVEGLKVAPYFDKGEMVENIPFFKSRTKEGFVDENYKYTSAAGGGYHSQLGEAYGFGVKGKRFTNYNQKSNKNFGYRCDTPTTMLANTDYVLDFHFVNHNGKDLKLEVINLQSQANVGDVNAAKSGTFTVPAYGTKHVSLNFHQIKSNTNLLTFIVFRQALSSGDLFLDAFLTKKVGKDTYQEETIKSDIGFSYSFSKVNDVTNYVDFLNVRSYADYTLNKEIKNNTKVTETGIFFSTNTDFGDEAFKTVPSFAHLSKNALKKDLWTLRINYENYKEDLYKDYIIAPYFVVDGNYFLGNRTVTSLSDLIVEKGNDTTLDPMNKGAVDHFINEIK